MWTDKMIIGALTAIAGQRTTTLGHRLTGWEHAKRKHGKGAVRATCQTCGKTAIITPFGFSSASNKMARQLPGIRGEAMFEACDSAQMTQEEIAFLASLP